MYTDSRFIPQLAVFRYNEGIDMGQRSTRVIEHHCYIYIFEDLV